MFSQTKNPFVLIFMTMLLVVTSVAQPVSAEEPALPNWAAIFNANGSLVDAVDADGNPGANGIPDYRDLYGGIDAIFIQDNISDSVATDMSVRNGADLLSDELVFNGTVDAPNDVGNVYVMASRNQTGGLQIYAGAELLSWAGTSPSPSTYIDFEFNQDEVRVKSGTPWPIYGNRTDGDLLVRMNFAGGALSSVGIGRWNGNGFVGLSSTAVTQACQSAGTYVFCSGDPVVPYPVGGYDVWDMDGNAVPSVAPDGFVQVGVDVASFPSVSTNFTSIVIRTPNDIVLSSFSAIGQAAQSTAGGN